MVKIKPSLIEKMIVMLEGNAEVIAFLLQKKANEKQKNNSLSLDSEKKMTVAELKKLWTFQKLTNANTGEEFIELRNYKGHETRITIPTHIGKTAVKSLRFSPNSDLESIEICIPDIEVFCNFDNCKKLADENGCVTLHAGNRCILAGYCGPVEGDVLNISDGITETSYYSFFKKIQFDRIVFPVGCTRINLKSDMKWKEVVIPDSVTEIDATLYLLNTRFEPRKEIVYGKKGSVAEEFAIKNGIEFRTLE